MYKCKNAIAWLLLYSAFAVNDLDAQQGELLVYHPVQTDIEG